MHVSKKIKDNKAAQSHRISGMLRRLAGRRTLGAACMTAMFGAGLLLSIGRAHAAGTIVYKENNTTDLNTSGSFSTTSGGTTASAVPSTTTGTNNATPLILAFDSTLTGALTVRTGGGTGATFAIDGILLTNPGGPLTINLNTGTTSIGTSGIDMSNATQNLTFSPSGSPSGGTVRIGPGTNAGISESWKVNTGTTLNINTAVSTQGGTNTLTLAGGTGGAGSVVLNGAVGQAASSVLNLIIAGANVFLNAANTNNGTTTVSSGSLTESSTGVLAGSTLTVSGGTTTLNGANTYTGVTTINAATLTATNTQAFGNPTTNAANQINITNAASVLNLLNDGGTGTVTGQTIIYGGPTASATGYNLTASAGTINIGSNGNAGSTNNNIQLGTFTFGSGSSTVNILGANGYALNFSSGLTTAGANNITLNTNTAVRFAGGLTSGAGKVSTFLGAGAVTFNGNLASTAPGTATAIVVGNTTSGGNTGNLVLKGTSSSDISAATVYGGSLTLYNAGSLGSSVPITMLAANPGALSTTTLNLRNDVDTNYGNTIAASATTTLGIAFNVDQATAGNSGHTLTLGTLTTNRVVTITNGNGYNLAFGAVSNSTTGQSPTFLNNMVSGTTTLASFTNNFAAAQTLTFGGTSATASTVVTGVIAQTAANALSVKQTGLGTLILNGVNTYTGGTTVSSGTLLVGNASALGASTGSLLVNGGILDIGAFSPTTGAVTLSSGTIQSTGSTSSVFNGSGYGVQSGIITANIGGSGGLTKTTTGLVTLTGANTYTGGTTISAGTLSGNTNSIGTGTVTDNATLDLEGTTGTVANTITGTGRVTQGASSNVSAGAIITLTAPNSYSGGTVVNAGTLSGGAGSYSTGAIVVNTGATLDYTQNTNGSAGNAISGAGNVSFNGNVSGPLGSGGLLTYTGADTAAGTTTANGSLTLNNGSGPAVTGPVTLATGATLAFGNNNQLAATSDVTALGTSTLAAGGFSDGAGTLGGIVTPTTGIGVLQIGTPSVLATTTLDFGDQYLGGLQVPANNTLAFSDSHLLTWYGTLNITNYTNGADQLYFGTSATGLTSVQLGQITFNGVSGASQLGNGQVVPSLVPAPEPGSWMSMAAGISLLGGLIARKRRKDHAA